MFKKRTMLIVLSSVIAISFAGCGGAKETSKIDETIEDSINSLVSENYDWPINELADVLPTLDSEHGEISVKDYDDKLVISVKEIVEASGKAYIDRCKEEGFVIESYENTYSTRYSAYNSDGYYLDLRYYSSSEKLSISIEEPKANSTLVLPTTGLASVIPIPTSQKGKIDYASESSFKVYVGDTTESEYQTYIGECIKKGFDVNYEANDDYFKASNVDGYSIKVEFVGFKTMYICVEAPDEESSLVSENSKQESETSKQSSTDSSGIRPEFKEAMDSYEAFFDEYIAFMETYANSDNQLALTTQYFEYLAQYSDMMEKMGQLGNEEMSDAEAVYYTEVTMRIYQKMANMNM